MSDHRQGRPEAAGDRNGDDLRRARLLQARQDFWDVPDEGPARCRAHRRSRVQSTRLRRRA